MKYFILALFCVGTCEEGFPECDTDTETRDPRFEILDEVIEAELDDNFATAASVAVWLDDEIVWVGGYGTSDPEGDTPPDEETLFMIGSDTKKITAISLLRKVQSGRIALDTPVAEVLPDLEMPLAPEYTGATVHELLSHQGGIVDGGDSATETTDEALRSCIFGEFAETYYAMVAPGIFFNYSNPNFSMAGLLDQELDSRMWADIVTEDLFIPLEMDRTVARKSEVDENHSLGFGFTMAADEIGPVSLAETEETAFMRPAGLVWSTPGDQVKLARFLVEGDDEILDASLLAEVTSAQVPIYPDAVVDAGIAEAHEVEMPGGSYGYGLFIQQGIGIGDKWYDIPVWGHGGNTYTHTSTFVILPEQRFAISILSNGIGDDFTQSVQAAVELLVDLPEPSTPPEMTFDPSRLDQLTGTYIDEYVVGEITVEREGDRLAVEIPLLDDEEVPYEPVMTPMSTRVWLANVEGLSYTVSFIDGPEGEIYLRNRGFVAVRSPGCDRRTETRSTDRRLPATTAEQRFDPKPLLRRPDRLFSPQRF